MIPLSSMTFEERERLCYAEGFTQAADLLGQLDDLERERDALEDKAENLIPVRYFIIDYENEDGPELIEVKRYEWEAAEGEITYERHTIRENGCNQICLSKA